MKINVAQLFTRKLWGSKEKNTYLVCGIIKTDEPLEAETTHILSADNVTLHESADVSGVCKGKGLDGIMASPIWKVKV